MRTLRRMLAGRVAKPMIVGFSAAAMLVSAGLAAALPFVSPGQEPVVPIPQSPLPLREYVDVNGNPLPFYTDEQVKEFLRTAEVVETESLPVGVTDPKRLKLEKDGIEVHAVFRYLDTVYDSVRMSDGRRRTNLKDSCHFEPAAYELAKLLRMDSVPPTVARRIGRDSGTLQIWIYNTVMEDERVEQGMNAPNRLAWIQQVHLMYLFDALIGNDDRTQQNILVDKNWKLWLIDHTRGFYSRAESPSLSKVTFVEKGFWEGLQALDKARLTEALDEYLNESEIDQILERRDRVAAHVQELIDIRGEGAVLYEWAFPGR